MRFTLGIEFHFTGSAVTNLAPGGRVVIVKNSMAFFQRYGSNLAVAGHTHRLSNGGEALRLVDRNDSVIQEFTYLDTYPWPRSADGGGDSLMALDLSGDYNASANWRSSLSAGGSPGPSERAQPAIKLITFDGGIFRFWFEAESGQTYR